MRKRFILSMAFAFIFIFSLTVTRAQGYINYSRVNGRDTAGTGSFRMQVVNGQAYTLDYLYSVNPLNPEFATTTLLTKHAVDGSVIYSTNLGLDSVYSLGFNAIKVINGEVYILGDVQDGLGFSGFVVIRLYADGTLAFKKYIGGTGYLTLFNRDIEIVGNEMLVAGWLQGSTDYPVTMGPPPQPNSNTFLTKVSLTDGAITQSMFIQVYGDMVIEGNAVYIAGSGIYGLPVTIGNAPVSTETHLYIEKLNISDFSTVYSRYFAESVSAHVTCFNVHNGELYMDGYTTSLEFPVTDGTTNNSGAGYEAGFCTKLNADGSLAYSTFLPTANSYNYPGGIKLSNGSCYIEGTIGNFQQQYVCKLNPNGSFAWLNQSLASPNFFEVINDDIYLAGPYAAPTYPVTNGSHASAFPTGFFTHLNSSGNAVFSTFLNPANALFTKISDNKIYLAGSTSVDNFPATDSSVLTGPDDHFIIVLKPDGTTIYSSYLGGTRNEYTRDMAIENGNVYIAGSTISDDYPITDTTLNQGEEKALLTKISFCPDKYATATDTLSPKIQRVCKYGLADMIKGQELKVPGDSLPMLYLNGIATLQHAVRGATYQWQKATSLTGPWTNIPNAIMKDYLPVIGAIDQYYRRRTFQPADCGSGLIHTSDTAFVLADTLTAPVLNAGGTFATCPGAPVTIGGTPTASGGTAPYASYTWDMGAAQVSNPTVSPATNTIYTLVVTDAKGCRQIDQAVVLVYKANAGADKSSCGGAPVIIGSSPLAGLGAVVYAWQPLTGLSSTTIAQPLANPAVETTYDLTVTIPKPGGGTCTTYDTVVIAAIPAPANLNFAGADKVICLGTTASLGTPAEAGFSYSWTPYSFISDPNNSATSYYPGNYVMPLPDPALIRLYAYKNGCTFSDEVIVSTIEARAGYDGCGPGVIGLPDRTPNINESYSWIKVSGPGDFTGPTNLPQVPVSASVGGTTVYGLTVSYNGGSCYDEVSILSDCNGGSGSSGGSCVGITIYPTTCAGYLANNGVVSLQASSVIPDAVYSWSPQQGLSVYTGNTVYLTDNIPRTYTVTATNAHDSSMHCSDSIHTNDPGFVAPVFHAPDTATCAGLPVMIGLPPVTGYTYEWAGPNLSSNTASAPIATLDYSTEFYVRVTNAAGCSVYDTVTVIVQDVSADAGPDWLVCSNGIVTLGTGAVENTSYLWEPQTSPWQNGTNQFSAQPQVLAATNVIYSVTATTSAGCVYTDTITVTVTDSPTIPDAPDAVSCPTQGTLIGSPALPGVSYLWTPAAGLNNPTAAQPYATPETNTTYTLTATFPGTCGLPATDQVMVTVNNPAFHMPDIHFCPADGPVELGINAPAGMVYYEWQPMNLVTDYQAANTFTLNPPPGSATVFTLYTQNQFGCTYTDTLTVNPFTDNPLAGADRSVCKGQPVNIGSALNTTGPSISYSWSPATYLDDPSSPNPLFTGIMIGTYQYVLTKTDNSFSCSTTDTIVLNVADLLPALISPTICRNSCVQIGTNPANGISYSWSPATGLSDPSIANPVACIDTLATTYTLTANDQAGCITSATVVIGVNAVPGVQASVPDVIACVGDNNVHFSPAVPAGSYGYLWSPDNGTLSNINIANPVIQTTTPGIYNYNLQITDNTTGCSNTLPANVQINACSPNGQAGNFMWFDTNANGLQDIGELGVSGAVVKLYNSIGFNMATAVTDANGFYEFPEVAPGNGYYITFSKPAGYEFTLQNVGGLSATNNSKADAAGKSNNFDLTTGADISNIDAGIKTSGTVPVTLLSFTAALHGRQTFLNWQTTAEYNNDYFDVERSIDGNNFIAIGRVAGHGTTNLPHNYVLVDPQPVVGLNYYRLKQFDFDGHFNYSSIKVVELKADENGTAWFNSQSNSIELAFNKNQNNLYLKLYAANGQLIQSATAANNSTKYSFKLPALAKGVYMLQVVSDKVRYSKKIFISEKR